ncbi:MAG: DUF342 domain-containing protein [Proteobacteria bacterium]|nr:DUF342 domain-containing protein [Pseudomonadota bacterium]
MEPSSQQIIVVECHYCKSLYRVPSDLSGKPVTCKKCRRIFLAAETQIKPANPAEEGFLLCKLALNYGLITEKNLESVLAEYSRRTKNKEHALMDALLVAHGGLSEYNLQLLKDIRESVDLRQAEKRFATEAVEKKFISSEAARKALARQAQLFRTQREKTPLLCDLLMESGELTQDQCDTILKAKKQPKTPMAPERSALSAPPVQPQGVFEPKPETPGPRPVSQIRTNESSDAVALQNGPKYATPAKPPPDTSNALPKAPPLSVSKEPIPDKPMDLVMDKAPVQARQKSTATQAATPPEAIIKTEPKPMTPAVPPPEKKVENIPVTETEATAPQKPFDEDTHDGSKVIPIQGLELIIAHDSMIATLRVPEGVDPSIVPMQEIKTALIEEDIVHGVAEESLIRGFLNSKIFREKPFKIAEGIQPKSGTEGQLIYYFDTDYLKIGAISEAGTIDFKDRGEIPYVKKGTLLAEITPTIQGKHGVDIYGRDITVPKLHEVSLRCENGTQLSEDKTKVFAAVNGQPKLSFGDRIHVLSELTIPGDVGFETGHIDFEGNIAIKGAVQADFTVKGANISANEVIGATIIAKGNLVVSNGISNSNLNVEGNVQAKFIHKCTITAYGNIIADKEIIDCSIENSGLCIVERGKIISSDISSKLGVEAQEIGTEKSKPCKLRIGVDDHIDKEADIIEEQILKHKVTLAELEKTLEDIEEREKELHKIIASLAHVQDRSQLDQKEAMKLMESLRQSGPPEKIKDMETHIKHLDQKAKEADESINKHFDEQDLIILEIARYHKLITECNDRIIDLGRQKQDKIAWAQNIKGSAHVKANGAIYNGTSIAGPHCSKTLKDTVRTVRLIEVRSSDTAEGWEIKSV